MMNLWRFLKIMFGFKVEKHLTIAKHDGSLHVHYRRTSRDKERKQK